MTNHISFDLWLTLIKSNPEAKLQKYKFLQQYLEKKFNLYYSSWTIQNAFRQVDIASTYAAEVTGKHIDFETMLLHVLSALGVFNVQGYNPYEELPKEEITNLKSDFNNIFLEYSPILYDDNTWDVLADLTEAGYSMNILSNTGFIEGKVLEVVLDKLNIKQFFKNRLYSDVFGIAKPNIHFFNKIEELYGIGRKYILHVGDNPNADYNGAIKAGMSAMIINSTGLSIIDLYDYLKKTNKWNI